jgi:hypothetical protein
MKLDRLKAVEAAIDRYEDMVDILKARLEKDPGALYGSRETGSVRRASLDLTRALADLRKPD